MTATTAPAPTVKSRLAGIKPTKLTEPLRLLVYGVEGVGKSSLAASAPAPIWFDVEGGSAHLGVARYPFYDGASGHVPRSYADIIRAIDDLGTSDHSFRTLVIDTVDTLEALLWRHICDRDSKVSNKAITSIEDYGFGKGYTRALDEWRALCLRLDRLRATKGMGILLIGHCQIKTFKSPDTDDFDRYNLRLNDKASGLIKEWADVCAFACFEDGAKSAKDERAKAKGFSTGKRLLKLERTAAYDAKSRIPLPAEIEMDPENPWAAFSAAVEEGESLSPARVAELIEAEIALITDEAIAAKARAITAEAVAKGDGNRLGRILMKLKRQREPEQQ